MKKDKVLAVIKEYGLFILIAFFVSSSLLQASIIPTGSMVKTIFIGDFVLVNRLAYDFYTPRNIPHSSTKLPYFEVSLSDGPKKGDIVVFEFPGNRDELEPELLQSWVKRCVGTPGDTIMVKDRILFVNNKEFPIPAHINYLRDIAIPQDEIDPRIFPRFAEWNEDNYGPVVVPKKGKVIKLTKENFYIYQTLINRELGRMAAELIDGQVYIDGKIATTYKIQKDYYFMMGDNRNDSLDSRYWGFVPRDRVLGEPLFVFYSSSAAVLDDNSGVSLKKEPWRILEILFKPRLDRVGKIL